MASTSNTPVIYDVRWVDGSREVAFLGKNANPHQQLFFADVETGSITAMTKGDLYVTAYDKSGDTIVYTVLSELPGPTRFDNDLVDADDRFLPDLIFRDPPTMEDIHEGLLLRYSNSLHVQKAGKEIPSHFTIQGEPLHLFTPTLTLSPDAKFLITVAPVREIPKQWEQYRPVYEEWRLRAGPVKDMTGSIVNDRRPEQYVAVNLVTGIVSPLIDAPAGRDLGYVAPTEAFWLDNNRHVIVTNTYLPLSVPLDETTRVRRSQRVTIALLDVSTGEIQTGIDLKDQVKVNPLVSLNDIAWDRKRHELSLQYLSGGEDNYGSAPIETYVLRAGRWLKTDEVSAESKNELKVSVLQDLNNPPTLWVQFRGRKASAPIWDPNPQFSNLRMGKAVIHHWQDAKGRARFGILALPPDYDVKHQYPLVIQSHGYQKDQYFATGGNFDTGSGGRALAARDIVVLQTNETAYSNPRDEGPDNLAAFASAIDSLVVDGVVERSRVGAIGFSRTAFHVRYSLIHHPDLFRAASITDGMDNSYGQYFLTYAPTYVAAFKNMEAINGGAPYGEGLANWVLNADGFNLDKIQAALLISGFQRGGLLNDWETYVGLRRLNKPVEYLWWWKGNTPHILVQPKQRHASQETAVDWFDFWLNGHEDSDPAKAEEYSRWRELRKLQKANEAANNLYWQSQSTSRNAMR